MLSACIEFSLRNKLIIGLLTLALIGWGTYSITQLPIDAVPDITNNQVQVITTAPSQAAMDIERFVTFPVEQSVATIPGLVEVRSFSRFGLSVVTIVFDESTDVYWARQQVGERLIEAKKQIPEGIGVPELAPVTTGLGEIYQYILKVKPGFEGKYSITDLRTIQDWIVRRQLLGTKGVADVGSFGGKLKQYEITIDPLLLRSMNISITDLMEALARNNQNTGGAYIEKSPNAYFIRSEGLLQSMDDIRSLVVTTSALGLPVQLGQVAEVKEGHAVRFGTMTQNGKGEAVGAVVMMLKGANSSQVIENVKARIAQISKTLPEGIVIEPFLDRTKLVNNAIGTVATNLAEGALIVVFVLVLLLGNLRAGLVVASVIPLSMLFAISLMNVFGVSGSLMSLGAIDFGLIVDGAVIIVEATLHHLTGRGLIGRLTQAQMDEEVGASAGKMMSAAAFGQMIILIVYLPILTLVGVEGKMFMPMAQTVIFALIGSFLLSLTYVPVVSSLFLSKNIQATATWSDRLIQWINKYYQPWLQQALQAKRRVILVATLLFVSAIWLFTTLGGEFLPELDEGDFAVDTRTLPGSSLTETTEATLKAERVLLDQFPEVVKVIGKIGSSEIPTDPMPIEAADMMVVMKDKKEWVSAETKDEMIEKMQKVLQDQVPGVSFGFQHPIQMRFNELMTGARQDVVIKIYGENLDSLSLYASHLEKWVQTVEGTTDIYKENITGLPQIVIRYDRQQLARLGLSVMDVNDVLNTAMAGQAAGQVFEGEKRFDLVVRADPAHRKSIDDVRNLFIKKADGQQIPITQVASVALENGPQQIQRDDAKRRIVVGFNTVGRDVQSIVNELQQKVGQHLSMAPGYYIIYGGTFQSLNEAKGRLAVAVPIALFLIFVLLYFATHSMTEGLLIFSGIPLSAMGGILALWIRGMPFSISAGIGFIALFGVAVLNGLVLLAEFGRLRKQHKEKSINEIIMEGTRTRLRPVIMTALVASLGFLPMAISNGSGAEVQKPLATVVIGGLLSATLLTLFVLPCLYSMVMSLKFPRPSPASIVAFVLVFFIGSHASSKAQEKISIEEAITHALQTNAKVTAAALEIAYQEKLKTTAWDMGKTQVSYMRGQYNSADRNDNNFTITQSIPFPTVVSRRRAWSEAQIKQSQLDRNVTENELAYEVKQTYYELVYLHERIQLLRKLDTLYQRFAETASLRYTTGEAGILEKSLAEAQWREHKNQLRQTESDRLIRQVRLQVLLNRETLVDIQTEVLEERANPYLPTAKLNDQSPLLESLRQHQEVAQREKRMIGQSLFPDITMGYFNQTLIGTPLHSGDVATSSNRFSGFQIGLSLPLWFVPPSARTHAARIQTQQVAAQIDQSTRVLQGQWMQTWQEYEKSKTSLIYYRQSALNNADELIRQATLNFTKGEISYAEYALAMKQALQIREGYLAQLHQLNQTVITLEYLAGER
jgi:cobalt-zinc-cadmium resistance protein CzcA